jgi:putative transposase
VDRTVRAYRAGTLGLTVDADGQLLPTVRTTVLTPSQQQSMLTLLKAVPHAYGWCRTRGSCAMLAATLQTTRGISVPAETMRRWLHEVGRVWKRAKLVAKDDDPHHTERLARIIWVYEQLRACGGLVLADELDIHLLPKMGCAGLPKGTQLAVMTRGQNQWHHLASALDPATGKLLYCCRPRKANTLFRDVLGALDEHYPAERYMRLSVVVDNY